MNINNVVTRLTTKYPELSADDIEELVYIASGILVLLYGVDTISEVPKRYENWLYMCCIELKERIGYTSVISYSEIGYSIAFASEQISKTLKCMVTPKVVIRNETTS